MLRAYVSDPRTFYRIAESALQTSLRRWASAPSSSTVTVASGSAENGGEATTRLNSPCSRAANTGEGRGATFTYTAPLAASSAPIVTEPTTLNLDTESRRQFFGGYVSAEWSPNARVHVSAGARINEPAICGVT